MDKTGCYSPFHKIKEEVEETTFSSSLKICRKMTTRGPTFEITVSSVCPLGQEDELVEKVVKLLSDTLKKTKEVSTYASEDNKEDY